MSGRKKNGIDFFKIVIHLKKANQISLPFFNNRVLLPGMVHESPYVKNFKKDLEPIELKRERLKRLNINLKGDYGSKF